MMLATPVLSSAWSSTSRTRAGSDFAAVGSTGNMDLRRQRRRLPGEHDLGAVPRCGDDRQRGPDFFGALLHAGHAEARWRPVAADPAAVVGHRQAHADRLIGNRADGDAPRAR